MKLDKLCCFFSNIAYKSRNDMVKIFASKEANNEYSFLNSYSVPTFYSSSIDAQCFVTKKDNRLFITFRGTNSIRDWLSDANIIRVPMDLPNTEKDDRPRVHWGFLRQFRSLQPMLDKEVDVFMKSLDNNNNANTNSKGEIIISGHSLGGAQSALASLQYSMAYPKVNVYCYSYGSPRVGSKGFVDLFLNNVTSYKRYVNEDDPVTMVPFALRFKHLPNISYLNSKNNVVDKTETTWWRVICDTFLSLFGRESPVGDHCCEQYLNKISQWDNWCVEDLDEDNTKELCNNENALIPAENIILPQDNDERA